MSLAARRDRWRRWCGSAAGRPSGPLCPSSSASARHTPERTAARPEPRIRPACTVRREESAAGSVLTVKMFRFRT